MALKLEVTVERWPIAGVFAISRGSKTEAEVVVAALTDGRYTGRGECVPYTRYGESVDEVVDAIRAMAGPIAKGLSTDDLGRQMPPGAARNALDCALIDFQAKRIGRSAADRFGLGMLRPVETAYTLSLDTPEKMAEGALRAADKTLLKLKLGGDGDRERVASVRAARPDVRLIVDANEAWSTDDLPANMEACRLARVELIEQPLPAGADDILASIKRSVRICADESLHTTGDLDHLAGLYDAVNIKLDKTGGLTEAIALLRGAEARRLKVMVGCMVGTSLAMAPALLIAQRAHFVDLDGPLLLARDREPGLRYEGSMIMPPPRELWG
jgi:L-alanine-DL-glutamate epimerase-like enolase superfamily enzyme